MGCEVTVKLMNELNQPDHGNYLSVGIGPEFDGNCFPSGDQTIEEVPLWDATLTIEESNFGDRVVISGADGPSGGSGLYGEFTVPCDMLNVKQDRLGQPMKDLTCQDIKRKTGKLSERPTDSGEFPVPR